MCHSTVLWRQGDRMTPSELSTPPTRSGRVLGPMIQTWRHVPAEVRRAGAPARDTRRFSRARARANVTRVGRPAHTGETTTPEHLHIVLHTTSFCTTSHNSAQQLFRTTTADDAHRQHTARKHTTHHAHTHAYPVVGSPTDPAAAVAITAEHAACCSASILLALNRSHIHRRLAALIWQHSPCQQQCTPQRARRT